MTHVTCRLTAKDRDQVRNPTLGTRVWATFTFLVYNTVHRGYGSKRLQDRSMVGHESSAETAGDEMNDRHDAKTARSGQVTVLRPRRGVVERRRNA